MDSDGKNFLAQHSDPTLKKYCMKLNVEITEIVFIASLKNSVFWVVAKTIWGPYM